MNAKLFVLAPIVFATAAATVNADVTRGIYQITPGGEYSFMPSPEGPGIPGGDPSDFRLEFGIGGWFVYELDLSVPTARLLQLNLTLTGNEAVQADPPSWGVVTADRVEEYLAGHTFVEDFIGGLLHLESSTIDGLKLTDGLNGDLALNGGFDNTPSDGEGILFNFSATAVSDVLGDTNADGAVDLADLNNVRDNLGGADVGDTFPFDGIVDLEDLNAVRNNFGAGVANAVPEPSSIGLALLGASGLLTLVVARVKRSAITAPCR